jgi:hypothetical protein
LLDKRSLIGIPFASFGAGCRDNSVTIASPGSVRRFNQYDGLPDGRQCEACKFKVLKAEWDADNSDETRQCRAEVSDGEPDAKDKKPDNIPERAECSGTNVALRRQFFSVDGLPAEGKKRKLPYYKAPTPPRNAND